jgi:hypothetical protein
VFENRVGGEAMAKDRVLGAVMSFLQRLLIRWSARSP